MHSWRVLLLPYLEYGHVYERYNFDEPWDGPNNRELAKEYPYIDRCPSYSHHADEDAVVDPYVTNYVVLVGPNEVFHGSTPSRSADVGSLASSTILLVDVGTHTVPWMTPQDLDLEDFFSAVRETRHDHHPGITMVSMADSSVQGLPSEISEEELTSSTGHVVRDEVQQSGQ